MKRTTRKTRTSSSTLSSAELARIRGGFRVEIEGVTVNLAYADRPYDGSGNETCD
jgi:hypothetical protein